MTSSQDNAQDNEKNDAGKPSGLKQHLTVGLIKLCGLLPLSVARGLGYTIGSLGWMFKSSSARTTLRNLQICFPDMPAEEHRRLAKSSMRHTGMLAIEVCLLLRRSASWLDSKIVRTNDERMKDAVAQGKGVIILAPHIGNWEVLSQTIPQYGPLTALYQPPKHKYLENLISEAREKTGGELVPTTRKGVVKLMNSVKNGGITGILPDQNPVEGSGKFAPFYGKPAFTMTLIHGFLQRVPCPVLVSVVKRVKGGFEIFYFDAPESIYSEDQDVSLRALNEAVEQSIQYCPAQYQWEYKRFRVRPEGTPDLYRVNPFSLDG